MVDIIVANHNIDSSFWDLPSCFYKRNVDLEEVFCIPWTRTSKGACQEFLYTIRYPEFKASDGKWAIRQSGLYHQLNEETSQSVFILLSPTPNSRAHQCIEERLTKKLINVQENPFCLHGELFSAYFPAWREYIAAHEKTFLPIANSTFAAFIDEPLSLGYDTLSKLIGLENRFLQVPTILAHLADVLKELDLLLTEFSGSIPSQTEISRLKFGLQNYRRWCEAYSRTTSYLQQRVRSVATLLSDTLSFRDQVVAKEQNGSMIQLNKSAVFITALTLLYLPSSFVGTFFGMNFLAMDQDQHRIVGSPMIWIYIVSSVVLTLGTILFYYWLLKRDGALFSRLAPKVRMSADWKQTPFASLTRRLTKTGNSGLELKESPV